MDAVTAHSDDDVANATSTTPVPTAPSAGEASTTAAATTADATAPLSVAWWFVPYAIVSVVHVALLATPLDTAAELTKLLLMPALAVAVVAARPPRSRAVVLLLVALVLSWLGDSAGTLLPGLPTIPLMLVFFGLAHVAYIVLFAGHLARRRLPAWSALLLVWWLGLLAMLTPILLTTSEGGWTAGLGWIAALAGYGLLLGATTAQATRCAPVITIGALLFLTSDSVLAFRLFAPDLMPDWTSPLVMATYTLGQGLIALGAVAALRQRARTRASTPGTHRAATEGAR